MSELEIRQLRYFVAVAQEGQMTRAARRLALAQPALSQAMARLETQVGAQLLERHPRGVALTQAGEAFLEKAQATLAAMDDVQATARSWARQQEDRLHIGFMSLTPPMMAGDLFSCFMADHPSATIEWRQLGYPSLSPRDWLGGSDAGLIWFAPTGPGLAVQPIRTSPLVVAMTNTHPLADRSELRVEDVLDQTFPGVVDWCDPGWLGYWGLDGYRGAPARRTEDGAPHPRGGRFDCRLRPCRHHGSRDRGGAVRPPRHPGDPPDRRRPGRADAGLAGGGGNAHGRGPGPARPRELSRGLTFIEQFAPGAPRRCMISTRT